MRSLRPNKEITRLDQTSYSQALPTKAQHLLPYRDKLLLAKGTYEPAYQVTRIPGLGLDSRFRVGFRFRFHFVFGFCRFFHLSTPQA